MRNRAIIHVVLVLAAAAGAGCGSERTSVSQYMDGCRDKQGFLRQESLVKSDGQPVRLGPVEFRPPTGAYLRVEADSAAMFQGVYCDSGDWGINPGNLIRLKLYPQNPPASLYADVPAEVAYVLKRKSPPTGTMEHEFPTSKLTWRSQIEFWGAVIPSIRTAFYTTDVGSQALTVVFVAESGSAGNASAMEAVLRSVAVRRD